MKLTDLTQAYSDFYLDCNDRAAYHASNPELFSHYHSFWGKPECEPVRLDKSELAIRRQIILDSLSDLEERCSLGGLNLSEIELILMVGQNTSNGHGWVNDGRSIAWLAVEAYTTPLLARVFITHELVHACHYQHNGAFSFINKDQLQNPLRQLLTEGIATYLSRTILAIDWATALWADYMKTARQRKWMRFCHDDISGLAKYFLAAMRNGEETSMFIASDPDDIYKYRSGYYLGLSVIETIVSRQNLRPLQLLKYSRGQLEMLAENLLETPSDLIESQ